MHELKTQRGVMRYDNGEWCKIWNRIDLPLQNWHEEFNKFWPEHSKISKICTLMGCFWPKYIMFELKKYRGVMFDCTQDWYKVWRKTGWCFQKLTWGTQQIFTRALGSLQIETLMSSFCLKLKMYKFKNYRGGICHDNEEWFEEELTCQFKIDMRNLTNFDPSTRKSQKFAL